MPHDIDELTTALRRAYPDITVEQVRAPHPGEEDGVWRIRHPAALVEARVLSDTGDAPFVVESDLAPPTPARSIDAAARLITDRLGLRVTST